MLSAKNTASADGKTRVPKREREKGRNSVGMEGEKERKDWRGRRWERGEKEKDYIKVRE